jgi:hypothetical protein
MLAARRFVGKRIIVESGNARPMLNCFAVKRGQRC